MNTIALHPRSKSLYSGPSKISDDTQNFTTNVLDTVAEKFRHVVDRAGLKLGEGAARFGCRHDKEPSRAVDWLKTTARGVFRINAYGLAPIPPKEEEAKTVREKFEKVYKSQQSDGRKAGSTSSQASSRMEFPRADHRTNPKS